MAEQFEINFVRSGRGKARCAPDARYPDGVTIDLAGPAPGCRVLLPYPAPECGYFRVECRTCGMGVYITAAGRPDDPRIVSVPCLAKAAAN